MARLASSALLIQVKELPAVECQPFTPLSSGAIFMRQSAGMSQRMEIDNFTSASQFPFRGHGSFSHNTGEEELRRGEGRKNGSVDVHRGIWL